MFVKATERLGGTARGGTKRGRTPGGAIFEIDHLETPTRAAGVTGTTAAAGLEALLALQAVDAADERRQKTIDDSHKLLDILDELKVGLLSGAVSAQALTRLQVVLETYDIPTDDPKLQDLVKAIDLRARVEIAKLRRDRH